MENCEKRKCHFKRKKKLRFIFRPKETIRIERFNQLVVSQLNTDDHDKHGQPLLSLKLWSWLNIFLSSLNNECAPQQRINWKVHHRKEEEEQKSDGEKKILLLTSQFNGMKWVKKSSLICIDGRMIFSFIVLILRFDIGML